MDAESSDNSIDSGRRNFARNLLGLWGLFREGLQGVPQMSLGDLDRVPAEVVAEMVPVFREGDVLVTREDGLYRVNHDGSEMLAYALLAEEHLAVEQYGGGRNLRTIARAVAQERAIGEDEAFEATRQTFLRLCREGCCHPAAAHLPAEEEE